MVRDLLSHTRKLAALLITVGLSLTSSTSLHAQSPTTGSESQQLLDPFDPFDIWGAEELLGSRDDNDKSADELLKEGTLLLESEHLLDARTKLLKALKKDPEDYRIHIVLSSYYLVHVGHYRLAMKYIKRAEELFEKKYGPPPYHRSDLQYQHGNILYYISQTRLNLDNYQGALDALDRFSSLGYYNDWYPGSRAWILMKLGNIKEAVRVARLGILSGAEPGRTLNMLGILLSMNDQPQESIEVFKKAIASEFSLGSSGQPATPLNNVGEVYRELFQEDTAESSFLRATSLKDGCEHVLPALNLTLLYIEQMRYEAAISAMDGFARCAAQFPLRNTEDHAALVSLARGRIDLHTGNVDRAIERFESTLQATQWLGKIGTNQNDLMVGATISLAQALDRKNNILRNHRPLSWPEWLSSKKEIASNEVRSWWLMRRARQMLASELNDIEDLIIRNTDSLLEYPTLGEVLAGYSRGNLRRRLEHQREIDKRTPATTYYDAYEAEGKLGWFSKKEANVLLESVIQRARPKTDDLLRTHVSLRRMRSLDPASDAYRDMAYRIFYTAPAELRNYGFKLPVAIDTDGADSALRSSIVSGPFLDASGQSNVCVLKGESKGDASGYSLRLSCPGNTAKNRSVEASDHNDVVNKLSDALFREEIKNGGST
jgi:tetratricopeptide (TPR) repeat protein